MQQPQQQQRRDRVEELAAVVRRCTERRDLRQGRQVHADIVGWVGTRHNKYLNNLLVRMYGECSSVGEARAAFDAIGSPNVYSWTMLLRAYAQNGQLQAARDALDAMPHPSIVSWNTMLTAYARAGRLCEAEELLEDMPHRDVVSWNALLAAYTAAGQVQAAEALLLERMPLRDTVSWNTVLQAYAGAGAADETCRLFQRMPAELRDAVSWTAVVRARGRCGQLDVAKRVFDAMPAAYRDSFAWGVLISAYADAGRADEAAALLRDMPRPDVVAATSVISAYAAAARLPEARRLFDELPARDSVAWAAMIDAYAQQALMGDAAALFDGAPVRSRQAWASMVSGYGRAGRLADAKATFDAMPCPDAVAWTAMIAAYTDCGRPWDAIALFRIMDVEGAGSGGEVTLLTVLGACADQADLAAARAIHGAAEDECRRPSLVNSLISVYGRCGSVEEARRVFDSASAGVVTWNAMLAAYAEARMVVPDCLGLFAEMCVQGELPDSATFTTLLGACGHHGMLAQTRRFFLSATADHDVEPTPEHLSCLANALARVGCLDQARQLVARDGDGDAAAWLPVLAACRGARAAALEAAARAVHDVDNGVAASAMVLLGNVLSAGGAGDEDEELID